MEKSLIFKARKWRRQFVFFRRCHRRANGASYCDVGNCQYMLFLIISFGFCKRESSSLFFVGFIVVVEEIYTSVACDFGDIWAYNACFLQLADCCFSCTMIRKLFFSLSSRLVPAMDCFHYVTYGIFALSFSLNQMFVIKFSVWSDTVVQRTRPTHVFKDGSSLDKKLKDSSRTPFSSNGQHTWLEIPGPSCSNAG